MGIDGSLEYVIGVIMNCKSVVLFSKRRIRNLNKTVLFDYIWFTEYTAEKSLWANNMRVPGEFYVSTILNDNSCFLERKLMEGPRLLYDINRWV